MGERGGEAWGWRGGKPAMQHSLNYSSMSEWVASDGEMEGKTKRRWRERGERHEQGGKEDMEEEEEVRARTKRKWQQGCVRGREGRERKRRGPEGGWRGGEEEGRKDARREGEERREGWRSRLNSVFPALESHSHCLLPSLSTHTHIGTAKHNVYTLQTCIYTLTHNCTLLTMSGCLHTFTHKKLL